MINKLNYKIKTRADENPVVHYNRLKPSKVITKKRRRVIKPLPQRDSGSEPDLDNLDQEQTVDEIKLNKTFIVDTGPTQCTPEPTRQISDLETERKDSTVEVRDVIPVSYTHLDVYKRQIQQCVVRPRELLSAARWISFGC